MKFSILFITALFLYSISYGQKHPNYLKIHAGTEIPVGFFDEGYKTGWGIHATDYFQVSKGGSIVLTTGFASWKAKIGQGIQANLLNVRFGYRFFAAGGLYFQVEPVGVGFYLDEHNSGAKYVYSAGMGYLFSNKSKSGFDISSKFNRVGDRSWVSINLGYQFKL
jgi:hypothetical protein